MARIVLGVTGGIAAYKAVSLLRELREAGHEVRVVPTDNALEFVGAPTWEALSGQPVSTSVFTSVEDVEHVHIGQEADLVIVAPATADLLARMRGGFADDLLTATLLVATCPVLVAPAMHTEMWRHPATVDNIAVLRSRGIHVIEPASGRLTGADSGPGRLPEPADLARIVMAALQPSPGVLSGTRMLISAGGTQEPLDPVRFLGNRSSGRQGIALAAAGAEAGAEVTLVAADVESPALLDRLPDGVEIVRVRTAVELSAEMLRRAPEAEITIMAAAVADYRPASRANAKMKKSGDEGLTIELVQNPDILAGLVAQRNQDAGDRLIMGFAAETGDAEHSVLDYARAKLLRKGCDLLAVNEVGETRGFATEDNTITLLAREGEGSAVLGERTGTKAELSQWVIRSLAELRGSVE